MQQYPAMFPRVRFQAGIQYDHAAADERRGVRGVARRVAKIGTVPDTHLPAVEKLEARGVGTHLQ